MASITFSTGLVTYKVNDSLELRFNPTDSALVERLYDAFKKLDEQQARYQAEVEAAKDDYKQIFEVTRKLDAEMRAILDDIFGVPVSEPLFGGMNVYAMADGLPVWANFLLALLDELDACAAVENAKTDARIAKYTAKYCKRK